MPGGASELMGGPHRSTASQRRGTMRVLTVNSGSSSLKFAIYDVSARTDGGEALVLSGTLDRFGTAQARARVLEKEGGTTEHQVSLPDHAAALQWLVAYLERSALLGEVAAVGHRFVHGGARFETAVRVTPAVRDALAGLVALAPLHLPDELRVVDAINQLAPNLPQVACFDTAFHRTMPQVARWFGLPRRLAEEGIVRYGFHGLSYEYVVEELRRSGALATRMIIAHLGNGASMTAVRDGSSIDTSMGLTPTGGLVMSTRAGDLDPGVLFHLMRDLELPLEAVIQMVTVSGGLRGLSGTTSDMRELLERSVTDTRAAEAVAIYCYHARKFIGAYVAALGGLDALIFTGGVGENAAVIRDRICRGLECFGIHLDPARNASHAAVISPDCEPVTVRVMRTNEELMIARHVARVLASAESVEG